MKVKENLNRYYFINIWKITKEGITNRTNVHRILGPWHTDARTNMFFVVKNIIGKMTHGRGAQTSKIWNYQKWKSSIIYKNFYKSKHLKQANNAIIFRQNPEKIVNRFFQSIINFSRNKINSFCFGKQCIPKNRTLQDKSTKYRKIQDKFLIFPK